MKKYLMILLLILVSCSNFPTRYDLIENEKVRLLDFMYEPAEAAPGDTVKLTAVFAGKEVTSEMINWKVSYKVVKNIYGADTAFEIKPLQCNAAQVHFTDRTSCVTFLFVIPDSIMYHSPMIKDNWVDILPAAYRNSFPDEYTGLSKSEIIDSVRQLASVIKSTSETELQFLEKLIGETTLQDISGLLQILTVNMRIYADVAGSHKIRSNYTVRYNSIFKKLSDKYFKMNNNPVIDSVLIYKVEGSGLLKYNLADNKHISYHLYGEERDSQTIISIDRKCTYFIRSFTSTKDSSLSLGGNADLEKHIPQYYYEHDPVEIKDVSGHNLIKVNRIDNDSVFLLIPPSDDKVKSFTLWLEISDQFLNEYNRPQGSTLKEFRGRFEYK